MRKPHKLGVRVLNATHLNKLVMEVEGREMHDPKYTRPIYTRQNVAATLALEAVGFEEP